MKKKANPKQSVKQLQTSSAAQAAYVKSLKTREQRIILIRIILLLVLVGAWEIGARTGALNAFVFSSPWRMTKTFWDMTADGSLFLHIGITLGETLLSFLITMLIGIATAVLLWCSRSLSDVLEPYVVMLNSLPKSALAPVLIVWLGNNIRTIIVAAVSVAVFGCIMTLYTGFREMDEDKLKLIRTLGGGKREIVAKVLIPGSIPLIVSSMKVNIGLCLVGVIIGEFLAANCGLGYLIIYGSQVFKLDLVMMSIVILCVISAGLYLGVNALEREFGKEQK
ncbi:MAG: ABC transporter permease [Lachnospiraceae bacterium]|nr:ABC transporter permease [Lachnospiraceae bacterium]